MKKTIASLQASPTLSPVTRHAHSLRAVVFPFPSPSMPATQANLTRAVYQIPLSKASMKYCGVATPFRGIRVYTRSAMGMPGSETALEELMCRVLGDFLQEGCATNLADDLYCGGDTPQDLIANWSRILDALARCNLRLSATKTVICPKTTTILGWIWSQDSLSASPHSIAALATGSPPESVKGMRSFIGAYKVLSRALPHCSQLVDPLESSLANLQSHDHVQWDDNLRQKFTAAQDALNTHKSIVLPRASDQLWIVTDGSVTWSRNATLNYASIKSHGYHVRLKRYL